MIWYKILPYVSVILIRMEASIKQLCSVIEDTIFITLFVTDSDQLQCFRCEFMNNYKLGNHKCMTIFFPGRYW